MYHQLLANIGTNLTFYRRNRLLLAASLFIMGMLGLTILPSLFFSSSTQHLEQVRMIYNLVNSFAMLVTAGAGLLLVSQHIRDRSIKMVFTKPCLPETWLLSGFLSAALVAFVLYAGSFLIASVLSAVWSIPFPTGIIFISVTEFFITVSLMSYVTFLSVIFHPVLAVMFALLVQERLFYWLKMLIASGIKAAGTNALFPLLKPLKLAVDVIYMVLPTFNPYDEKKDKITISLRGSDADWNYLLLIVLYSLALSLLFYFLTVFVLKRKRYI